MASADYTSKEFAEIRQRLLRSKFVGEENAETIASPRRKHLYELDVFENIEGTLHSNYEHEHSDNDNIQSEMWRDLQTDVDHLSQETDVAILRLRSQTLKSNK